MKEWTTQGRKLKLVEGNIILLDVDAIVNAANKNLILGGGVAGAIRNSGGPSKKNVTQSARLTSEKQR